MMEVFLRACDIYYYNYISEILRLLVESLVSKRESTIKHLLLHVFRGANFELNELNHYLKLIYICNLVH